MRTRGVGIHIKVANFERSKRFYEDLGLKKVFEYGPKKILQKDEHGIVSVPEDYNGVTFQYGDFKLEVADDHRAVKSAVFKEKIPSSKVSIMIYVEKISEVVEQCKKTNIPLAVGPRHYYWGTLEVVVKDPDGFVIVFIAPYTKEEAKEINADERWAIPPGK